MTAVHWLRVTRTCNNACVFCSETEALDNVPVSLAELEAELDAIDSRRGRDGNNLEVRLAGGEPTLSPHLPAIIASAARRGLRPVLVTNGRALAKPGRLAHLVSQGLVAVRISLHGASPTSHDAVVGVQGAFRQTLAALADAGSTSVRRTISFVLSERNVGDLPALITLAQRVGCHELELRDVLPTPDRERFVGLRLSDEAARIALQDATKRAARAKVHLRTIGFERAAANARHATFSPDARWPNASARPALAATPTRVVLVGDTADTHTFKRAAEAVERRGICTLRVPRGGAFTFEAGDLVVCAGYREARDLFDQQPGAADVDVRVIDFHMLDDFGAFRSLWVPQTHEQTTASWWPSERLAIVSCFPGYPALYEWYGVPPDALRVPPFVLDPREFGAHPEPRDEPYVFSGGEHLRDVQTLVAASALRRGEAPLPMHLYHYGPAGPAARGLVYRGSVPFAAFYRAVAASRFVVLPLSRDPTCAAGITVAAMALAAGRAVVASATPAMRDHLDDGVNAILVEPEDPHALAAAIDRLEQDDELRGRLERGAREAAARATAETLVDVLLETRATERLSGDA